MKNLSRPENQPRVGYTTIRYDTDKPGSDVSRLMVGRLGARTGDVVQIEQAKQHTTTDFVRDFNSHPPKGLENVSLGIQPEKPSLRVDGEEFLLLNPRLSTNKLQVYLRAELEQTRKPIFFSFDGESTRMRFLEKWSVERMSASDSRLDISYQMGRHHAPTFRFRTDKFDGSQLHDDLKLASAPEYSGDSYTFLASPKLQALVKARLDATNGPFDRNYEKGDISEEIQRHLLSVSGEWNELEYHPFDKSWRVHESRKKGPDSVQQSKSSDELSYFEFRWSEDSYQAYLACRKQALDDLRKWPTYDGKPVNEAHVGILEWDVRKRSMDFRIRGVRASDSKQDLSETS